MFLLPPLVKYWIERIRANSDFGTKAFLHIVL